ncbi:hypothetical protein JN00_0199 [Metamycoplasma subdolum]|uniref:Uncharacterized protein n=1 Tax=Metamycoplasma subdolum TaxID=92407 RepID=A0A3M0A196_9BACT|nr:hypothetical protein [Metamycoplasma subdolum]RMA78560.1 hypothetical protein JN00_0199 [Metamycoplasma subdolum]WPB50301.1 hypothetical protein R9C05_01670 [Metamycoplasma subdolum]
MNIINQVAYEENRVIDAEEKVNYRVEKQVYDWSVSTGSENIILNIRRLVNSDEILLEFVWQNFSNQIKNPFLISTINNKIISLDYSFQSTRGHVFQAIVNQKEGFKNFTFNDLKNMNFEIGSHFGRKLNEARKLMRFTYFFDTGFLNKNYIISNETLRFKIMTDLSLRFFTQASNLDASVATNSSMCQLHFLIEPKKFELAKNNVALANVHMYKKWTNSSSVQTNLNQSDTSAITVSDDGTKNDLIEGKNEIFLNSLDSRKSIQYSSSSFYDVKAKKTIISPSDARTSLGLIIPLTFVGTLTNQMKVEFGKGLQGFKVTYNQAIAKPFFNVESGLIKLKIESEKLQLKPYKKWENLTVSSLTNKIEAER